VIENNMKHKFPDKQQEIELFNTLKDIFAIVGLGAVIFSIIYKFT